MVQGGNTKIVNPGPGGVKFFKFTASFQIGAGYKILGRCLSEFLKKQIFKLALGTNFSFFNQHFTFMINEALKAPRLVALPWQNTQNLTFINLILLHGALLISFGAGNQQFNRINTHNKYVQ